MFFFASADDALHLYKILQNIFNTFSYRVDTTSTLQIEKGQDSVKIVCGVMVLDLCISTMIIRVCTMFCEKSSVV